MAKRKKIKEGQEFYFCNGTVAHTITECRKCIESMSLEEFTHHVNDTKHDVYTWIRDCIDPALAETIKNVRDKASLTSLLR